MPIDWGENLNLKISKLPDSPGCYLMKDENGTIIYVGKAVNLKNRVRSYFRDTVHTPKVAAMISHIADFDILLCDTNLEALCLECNLIKTHRPYYNILLKDDKHYPYIRCDLRESFPRLTVARRRENDGARYYGPYIGASAVKQVLEVARDVFPLRTCTKALTPVGIGKGKPQRPCINYEIGRCLAPCAGRCTEAEYWDVLDGAIAFLAGDWQDVVKKLRKEMEAAAMAMQYEKAAILRDKIRDMEGLLEKQLAIQTNLSEQDIIALSQDGMDAMAQILYVRGGRMVGGDHFLLIGEGAEEPEKVLEEFLLQYYEDAALIPRHVLVSALPAGNVEQLEQWLRQQKGSAVTLAIPKRGEKHELIRMAEKNAEDALDKRNAKAAVKEERTIGAAASLGQILGLEHYPRRIEGYDNSHTQGVLTVGSMVVFVDGVPAKKEYRHFRMKGEVVPNIAPDLPSFQDGEGPDRQRGANDFASMYEMLTRRFAHGIQEREERLQQGLTAEGGKFSTFPDLILIDGGPVQLEFARQAIGSLGIEPPPMFGLAKREEEIWLPGATEPICLDHHTPELHLIQRIRDEAHRFGITHHRALRGKAAVHSQLEDIPGIGPKRRKALLNKLGSVKAVKEATMEQLLAVPGMNTTAAEAVLAWAASKKE